MIKKVDIESLALDESENIPGFHLKLLHIDFSKLKYICMGNIKKYSEYYSIGSL